MDHTDLIALLDILFLQVLLFLFVINKKKYRLKTYYFYYVGAHVLAHYHSVSSLLNEKFNCRRKVAGAENVFEKISDVLLPRLCLQNFVSQTGMHKPQEVLLSGPSGTGRNLIGHTICGMLNI